MLTSKSGPVTFSVIPNPLTGVRVALSFKVALAHCVFARLQGQNYAEGAPKGTEAACLAFALWLRVNNALCGDPIAAKKSKVGSTVCGAHNGHFTISWEVKGTLSAARKSLKTALMNLKPAAVSGTYGNCMRSIGLQIKKDAFNAAVKQFVTAISGGVSCWVTGNIKVADGKKTNKETGAVTIVRAQTKADDVVKVLAKALSPGAAKSPQKAGEEISKCDLGPRTRIAVSGWSAWVLADYIKSKLQGVQVVIADDGVVTGLKASQLAKLKKGVDAFIASKHGKIPAPALGGVLAYLASSSASLGYPDIVALSKVSVAEIKSALHKNL